MMRDLQENEVEMAISIDIRDGGGSGCGYNRTHVETDLNFHSHMGSVLAEALLSIEQGSPEAFCRIMVATLGSGRRIISDVMNDSTASTSVLKRFAEILEEAEGMNFDNDSDRFNRSDENNNHN